MKKVYHITYFESSSCYYSKGINIEANNELKAMKIFRKVYPKVVFFSMILKNKENE